VIRPDANAAAPLAALYSATGHVTLWSAGVGENSGSGTIPIRKPDAGATVAKAFLFAATTGQTGYDLNPGDISINGTAVVFDPSLDDANQIGSFNDAADVTTQIAAIVNPAPAGVTDITVGENNGETDNIDGEGLAVIFNDPAVTANNTIILLYGAQNPTGDQFNINLTSPLNTTDPSFYARMGLGSSFSYDFPGNAEQFSVIHVDGTLLSSSAGGQDDCDELNLATGDYCQNGELMTFGGPNHGTAHNPPDPTANSGGCVPDNTPLCDGEYYNLAPFLASGDSKITVNTLNPSDNDNIFYSSLELGDVSALVNEGILLTPATATVATGTAHTLSAHVQDANGNPIMGTAVAFTVVSGPNAGHTGNGTTDSSGNATFTYTSSVAGTDTIQSSFTDPTSGLAFTSNQVTTTWTSEVTSAPTTLSTSLSGGGKTGAAITVPPGTSVTDAATLAGANGATATGNVAYSVYSNSSCTTSFASGGTVAVAGGVVPVSSAVAFPLPGTYYWMASYTGNATNGASTSTCGAETVTVAKGAPTITTTASGAPAGGQVSDIAHVTGGFTPMGQVTFSLFAPGDVMCTTPLVTAVEPLNGGIASTGNVAVGAAGTYNWVATYGGDTNNDAATSPCGSEKVIVTPQTMTGQAYALSASATLLGATLLNLAPGGTGAISTTSSLTASKPCAPLSGLVTAQALCASVVTVAYPAKSTATASIANVTVGLPTIPTIVVDAISSTSTTTCSGSSGSVTIAYLAVGNTVVISKPTAVAPNTTISVGVVKLVLNQQIPFSTPDNGLTVNGFTASVKGLGLATVNLVMASSESDIGNCP